MLRGTNPRKRRCRTGCLTCRSRKVKCDEGKPDCQRCLAANVECLGYDPKRPARTQRLVDSHSPQTTTLNVNATPPLCLPNTPVIYRSDGLPLVGLPTNPRPSQRPHLRARDVLGYNQYFSRTVLILFPEEHLVFWRDSFSEESFESECIFDLLVSLGTLHRATLLNSLDGDNDRSRGLDTQVIAVQTYIHALQGLAQEFNEIKKNPSILSGTLILFAYFECFLGNIPATLRHVRAADFYFRQLQPMARQASLSVNSISSALKSFSRLYQMVLPDLGTLSRTIYPASSITDVSLLCSLLDLSSGDPDVESMVWSPLSVHSSPLSFNKIAAFQEVVRTWKVVNLNHLPDVEPHESVISSGDISWATIEHLPIPVQSYSHNISSRLCLVAAIYNFFMARTSWALSAGGHNAHTNELVAYIYFHEAIRWSLSVRRELEDLRARPDTLISCEDLTNGVVSVLYLIGMCCPSVSWLQSVTQHLNHFGQEGLLNGKLLGRCLNTMYLFELHSGEDSATLLTRFPPPLSRVIPVLMPDIDSGGFTAFYARPCTTDGVGLSRYRPIGQARWGNCTQKSTAKPSNVEFFSDLDILQTPFDEWLGSRQTSEDWKAWLNTNEESDLALSTQDHIHGSRFVFDSEHSISESPLQ